MSASLDDLFDQPRGSRLRDLVKFAQDNRLEVGSTTSGRHNRGSKHYSGNAIDLRNSGNLPDDQVQQLSHAAAQAGLKLRDERRRPVGQAVWGGPHLHLETDDQSLNDLFDTPSGQTPPAKSQRRADLNPPVSPKKSASSVPRVLTGNRGAALLRQYAMTKGIENAQRQREEQTRAEVEREYRARRGPYGNPTASGALHLIANPVDSLTGIFRSDEENINRETQERLRQQQVAAEPEVESIRKEYGQMSAPVRSVAAPLARGGAGLLKVGGGIASAFGIAPNRLSEWANKRGEIIETGASLPPLAEERGLSSLITGKTKLKEVERGIPEKIATGIADLGVGLGEIMLLKKATRLPFNQLLALETAARNSDKSAGEQLSRATEAYALGTALDRHLSRPVSAVIAGAPTAAQTGYEVSQGRMSPLDAAIQTGIQAGSGALLTSPKTKEGPRLRQVEETPAQRRTAQIEQTEADRAQIRNEIQLAERPDIKAFRERRAARQQPSPIDDLFDEPQVQTKPPVEAERAAGTSAPTGEAPTPARFYHRDFGEVVESPNQRQVGKGRVRVVGEDGKEHVIKRSAMTGAGNRRAVPIRAESQPIATLTETETPNPVSTIPERPETLDLQLTALREGRRDAVLVPPETTKPERPRGLAQLETPVGTFYFNPRKTSVNRIQQKVKDGTYGELLGHVEPKPAPGEPTAVVSAKEGGVEVQSSAVSPERAAEQARATQQQNPRAEVAVGGPELAQEVVAERTSSARNTQLAADRAELDLPELPDAQRKSWQRSLDNAQSKGLDRNADRLADEIFQQPRTLSDEESAGLTIRVQQLKNEHAEVMSEIERATDPETIKAKVAERDAIEASFDKISRALKDAGTETARALASRKLTINEDYDLVSVLARAKAAKKSSLTETERVAYERLVAENKALEERLAKAEHAAASRTIQQEIDRVVRRRERTESRKSLDDEAVVIRERIAAAWAKVKQPDSTMQASGLGRLDPLVEPVLDYARNRIRAGITDAEQLVDDVHTAVRDVAEISRRDIQQIISGYGLDPRKRQQSQVATELARIRKELREVLEQEDVAAGRRSTRREGPTLREGVGVREGPQLGPRQGPSRREGWRRIEGPRLSEARTRTEGPRLGEARGRRQGPRVEDAPFVGPRPSDVRKLRAEGPRQSEAMKLPAEGPPSQESRRRYLEQRAAELEGQLASGNFTQSAPRPKPIPTEEVFRLERRINDAKRKIEERLARDGEDTLTRLGRRIRDVLGLYRAVETSFDASWALRQGKIGLARHPVLWSKAFLNQFKGLSNDKYFKAAREIENDPDFRYLNKFGLELPSVDSIHVGRPTHTRAEEYQTELAHRIPGLRQSEQLYNIGLDTLRVLWGKHDMQMLERAGFNRNSPTDFKVFKETMQSINDATGRTSLDRIIPGKIGKTLNTATPAINVFTYAARFWASRLKILTSPLDPRMYPQLKATKGVYESLPRVQRVEAWKRLFAFYGLWGAQAMAMKYLLGFDLDTDPDSADFGKLRRGKRVYDFSAGTLSHLRLAARITKRIYEAKTGQKAENPNSAIDTLGQYLRTKESPTAGRVHDIFLSKRTKEGYGTDFKGDPVYPTGKPGTGFLNRLKTARLVPKPLGLEDATEAYDQLGWGGVATSLPVSFLGEGVQTYPKKTRKRRVSGGFK